VLTVHCPDPDDPKKIFVKTEILPGGVSRLKLAPGCRTRLKSKIIISDYSSIGDADIKYITIPRTPDMDIPNMNTTEVETSLKQLHLQGELRPTIKELREVHSNIQARSEFKNNVQSDIKLMQEDFLKRLDNLQAQVERNTREAPFHPKDWSRSPSEPIRLLTPRTLQMEIDQLEKSKMPFLVSLILWIISFLFFIIVIAAIFLVYRKFTYFRNIFSEGLGGIKVANLKPILVEQFKALSIILAKPVEHSPS
jgi:hypothetical protein